MHRLVLPALVVFVLAASGSAQTRATADSIVYSNGDVVLAATLHLPPGDGPFAGVVLVHGSGTSDRRNPWTTAYAGALVARGIAVLHPDKRGSGASGGDWRTASFHDLAGDALAAADALHAHPRIDRERVGAIGFSQGGQVVPIVATLSDRVSFVVDVSGAVVPIQEQIGDELRMMAEREGVEGGDLHVIEALHDLSLAYAQTGEGWNAYADRLGAARSGPLGDTEVVQGFPTSPDAAVWGVLRSLGDFDPLPYWTEVGVPSLFLFGGRDENVDVLKSARIIQQELTDVPYSLLLFQNNGHALYREDALDFLARWVLDGGAD